MNSNLRASKSGHQTNWTKEEVLAGLTHFFKIYRRYPTAREIDIFEYLPSSRSIQRQFGGLVVLRKELIPDSHSNFTQGSYRSEIASKTYKRATLYEEEFYNFLLQHFQPLAVHEHKIIRPGNVSSDYFIYLNEEIGVVIDLFYAKDRFSLGGVINIKLKRYSKLPFNTYFVLVGNGNLTFQEVADTIARRKIALPTNILIDSEQHFKESTIFEIKQQSIFSI
ncbi:TPA: hypothetical protein DIS56_00020 [Candidatus Saccharibacteria bacterium]|nr:MAG: hypothetical protein UX30_C0003G0151 [Candidatus Saccharibacteria bacterium GW2011_GWA2_46_10]OGL34964.1 MAG: hypothetical protein A3F05_00160 [Candidatus Saccharibacteria bacterium RIFCSPHIGHO2_12_FULL_47_17]HCM51514.1 hypothetical protein [Candidatus Saccharibacteria bacterium]